MAEEYVIMRKPVLAVGSVLLIWQFALAHSAIEPVPRSAKWLERHELLKKRAAEAGEKAQIVFIGDSITEDWAEEGKEIWARYYEHRNAVNLGIGGDQTQHVLWRLDNGALSGLKPKVIVVMIGTNNSSNEPTCVSQIADGVTAVVRNLRNKLPETKILLLGILPRDESPDARRGNILQINQILRNLGDDRSIFWIDFGYKLINSDGTIPAALMPDYGHLSAKGYEMWAEAIEETISRILGDKEVDALR
jgi:lysophospholipase L1-like esterase